MKMKNAFLISAILLLSVFAQAQSSASEVLAPLQKVYDLVFAALLIVGVLALFIGGAMFLFAGNNMQQRENAKSTISYALMGLIVIAAAPFAVNYMLAG